TGLLREPARELNRGFFSRMERGRPWVRVKLAMSLDGRTALANGASRWISGEAARADVQHWRARSSALLTGIGTVLADDPRLTVGAADDARGRPRPDPPCADDAGEQFKPLRVVLDGKLKTPRGASLLDHAAPTLFVHATECKPSDDRFANAELAGVALDAS